MPTSNHLHHDYDPLTGLPNRTLFQERATEAVRSARDQGHSVAVLMIALEGVQYDSTKPISATDRQVLQIVGQQISDVLRKSDTVARFAENEFAVLARGLARPHDSALVAQRLLACLSEPAVVDETPISVAARIGISVFPDDGRDVDVLLRNTDAAIYEARKNNDSYRFYAQGMSDNLMGSLLLGRQMRTALDNDEFRLHFQPIMDLATDSIIGFEALIRWQHPERGLLMPDQFIPLAEQIGLIGALGDWVLEQACRQTGAWRTAELKPPRIAVNLSAVQFRDQHFRERVTHILERAGMAPDRLLLEITESMMLPHPDHIRNILRAFGEMGIRIAIDDFGTGYSSLAYLRDLPVHYLKVDKSFVDGLPSDGNACTITRAVMAMAHSLGLKVVAEGVETAEQLKFVRDTGCEEAQGYYFSRPVPAEEAETLWHRQHVVTEQ